MKRKLFLCTLISLVLIMSFTACETPIQTVDISAYAGWWAYYSDITGVEPDVTLDYIEISADNAGVIRCYSETGQEVDSGILDTSGELDLSGESLMAFLLTANGDFYLKHEYPDASVGRTIVMGTEYEDYTYVQLEEKPEIIGAEIPVDTDPYELVGWWALDNDIPLSFTHFEVIEGDTETIYCYDVNGEFIENGYISTNEGRELTEGFRIYITFDSLGEFELEGGYTDTIKLISQDEDTPDLSYLFSRVTDELFPQ